MIILNSVVARSSASAVNSLPLASTCYQPFLGDRRFLAKGEELFAEGELADFFFKVTAGAVPVVNILTDGRRQIDAFHFAGDLLGIESIGSYGFTVEAVENTRLIAFRRSCYMNLVRDDPTFAAELMSSMSESMTRAHDHMLLLRRKTPQEKIAMFLVDMGKRLKADVEVDLPMQRTDIADHLGLTKETVSRTLTQMRKDGLIGLKMCGRTIHLKDKRRLQELVA